MEFRAGSSQDAEAIAGLIASFQSELTDDPSGADAEEYLACVSAQAAREYLDLISEHAGAPITLVGVGPGRDQVIWTDAARDTIIAGGGRAGSAIA